MRVSFEATRLSAQCLIEAYACLAPSRRRTLHKASSTTLAAEEARRSRAGKVSMRSPRAALYARVSSDQQAHGGTIASQVASLRERITADGARLEPEHVFLDEGYSGATLLRPALERLRDAVAAGAVDRLYVHSPDRLARRYAYQVLLIEEFRRAGVEVVFLNRPIGGSAEDDLLLQVQGMIAEYERARILERGRRGRRHAARSGSVSALCAAPFGYRYIARTPAAGWRASRWSRTRPGSCARSSPGSAWSGSACMRSAAGWPKPAAAPAPVWRAGTRPPSAAC